MRMTKYTVTDSDGTFLDEFSDNAPDLAEERIGHTRSFHPNLKVTETDDTLPDNNWTWV